jgi:hypothetical protein
VDKLIRPAIVRRDKLGRFQRIGHRITGDRRGQSNARARGEGAGWEFVHVCVDDVSRIGRLPVCALTSRRGSWRSMAPLKGLTPEGAARKAKERLKELH